MSKNNFSEKYLIAAASATSFVSAFGLSRSFWGDEAATYQIISGGWAELWQWFTAGDPHPPLYFALLKIWSSLFGYSEIALRLPSVLLFPIIVFLTWKLAARFGLSKVGRVIAVWIVALHPSMWIFVPMARYYALTAFLFLLATLVFLKAIERGKWLWVIYTLILALLFWTDFPAFLIIIVHAGIILWKANGKWPRWAISVVIALILSLPPIFLGISAMANFAEDAAPSFSGIITGLAYSFNSLFIGEVRYFWQIPCALGLVAVIALTVYAIVKKPRLMLICLLVPFAVGIIIMSLVSQEVPFVYLPSRLLFMFPLFGIGIALTAEKLKKPVLIPIVIALGIGYIWGDIGATIGRDYINKAYTVPWREIAEEIDKVDCELAICRDWGAIHYFNKYMDTIEPREIEAENFPDGRIAHIIRFGNTKTAPADSLVYNMLLTDRGEPIAIMNKEKENPTITALKETFLKRKFSEYIVRGYIFSESD